MTKLYKYVKKLYIQMYIYIIKLNVCVLIELKGKVDT